MPYSLATFCASSDVRQGPSRSNIFVRVSICHTAHLIITFHVFIDIKTALTKKASKIKGCRVLSFFSGSCYVTVESGGSQNPVIYRYLYRKDGYISLSYPSA